MVGGDLTPELEKMEKFFDRDHSGILGDLRKEMGGHGVFVACPLRLFCLPRNACTLDRLRPNRLSEFHGNVVPLDPDGYLT